MIEQHALPEAENEDFTDELSDEALDRMDEGPRATIKPSSGNSHGCLACC